MSTPPPDNSDDLQSVEELLRTLAPAAVPPGLRRDFAQRLEQLFLPPVRLRVWPVAAAAAAVCMAAAPLAFRQTGPAKQPAEQSPEAAAFENFLITDTPDGPEETTEVLEIEDAGTTPLHGGAYRIVRVTLVHRTWDSAVGESAGRVLSERTSQSYMAVPLEIF